MIVIETLFYFQPMTRDLAVEISGWTYAEPYSLYSMDGSEACIAELLGGSYFAAKTSAGGELIGFICYGDAARVPGGYEVGLYDADNKLDIGLGLRPDMTGKGWGQPFLLEGMRFLAERLSPEEFQLVVAAFNRRAIQVYERSGFQRGTLFQSKAGEREIDFIAMSRRYV
ncbi:N-acetyltransferase [Paenibacillus faecis]|uniref:GNAT family N-acetyltransferase n=1 Tax=Paenibacillus faecis TaxID=862114 RepID=UPI001B0F68AE|nr:GNAT family protein [Paenibacillus faecis]GIO83954.1 N-acetyltransferase [Paenibacillus faecis]